MNIQAFLDLSTRLDPLRQVLADLAVAADLLAQADTARQDLCAQTDALKATCGELKVQVTALETARDQAARTCKLEITEYTRLLAEAQMTFQEAQKSPKK